MLAQLGLSLEDILLHQWTFTDTVVGLIQLMEVITDRVILSRQSLGRLELSICMYEWMLCERECYVEQPNNIVTQTTSTHW